MVRQRIRDPKVVGCICLTFIFLCALVVLLISGGILFSKENPKVVNYANSMCRVDSGSYETYLCRTRYKRYNCYGPIWHVSHGEHQTMFAIIKGEMRYSSRAGALQKTNEYQVSEHSQREFFKK